MAFVKDHTFIIDKMQAEKLPFYQVLDNDGKTIIDENDDKETGVDEASRRLLDLFDRIRGTFTVKLSNKTKADKATGGAVRNLTLVTKINETTPATPVQGIGAINSNAIAEIEAKLEEKYAQKFESFKREQDLLRRIEKLEEEKQEPDMLEKYAPYIQGLFGLINQAPGVPLNGSPNINGPAESNPIHSRINAAIKILYANDKNFVNNLEKLADIAQNKPLVYAIAIEKLKEY
jgi:hypothetical protein